MHTASAKQVENAQLLQMSAFELNFCAALPQQYSLGSRLRSGPSPNYNCHGMTFASRRTGIWSDAGVKQVLMEDHYVEVHLKKILPGDVIVYFSPAGEATHSGIVVREPAPTDLLPIPLICSKWGKGPEVVHPANQSPYGYEYKFYRVHDYVPSISP